MSNVHLLQRAAELHHRDLLSKRQNDVPRPIPKKITPKPPVVKPTPTPTPTRAIPTPTPTLPATVTTPTTLPPPANTSASVPSTTRSLPPASSPSDTALGAGGASSGTGTAVLNKTLSGAKPSSTGTEPTGSGGISTGTLIGVIAATIIGVLVILALIAFLFRKYRSRNRDGFSPTRFRKSAINLNDDAPSIVPRPPTMIQNHMDNNNSYSAYNNYHSPYDGANGQPHPAFLTMPRHEGVPRNEAPLPPVPAAAAAENENPFLPPAYTPSDTSLSPTSTSHSFGQQHNNDNRYTAQSFLHTAHSESVYSQPSYFQPDPSTYMDLMRANAANAPPTAPSSVSAYSVTTGTTATGYPSEKGGYHLANPSVPPPVTVATTSNGYPDEKAAYKMQLANPTVPPPAASASNSNDRRPMSSTLYTIDDAYGGM